MQQVSAFFGLTAVLAVAVLVAMGALAAEDYFDTAHRLNAALISSAR